MTVLAFLVGLACGIGSGYLLAMILRPGDPPDPPEGEPVRRRRRTRTRAVGRRAA